MSERNVFKFRAKLKEDDSWFYWTIDYNSNVIENVDLSKIDKFTISQFTGLYDREFREIYENDIFEVRGVSEKFTKIIRYIPEKHSFCIANLNEHDIESLDPWSQFDESWWIEFQNDIELIGTLI